MVAAPFGVAPTRTGIYGVVGKLQVPQGVKSLCKTKLRLTAYLGTMGLVEILSFQAVGETDGFKRYLG